jgi:hypothetical protein
MGMIAVTAIVDYLLPFADLGKQTSVFCFHCSKQTELCCFRFRFATTNGNLQNSGNMETDIETPG